MSNQTTETVEKKDSAIVTAHKAWVAAGSPKPTKADGKQLLADYRAAKKARDAAEKALTDAQAAESDAVKAIVLARGKGRLRIDGEVHIPMARGNTFFFRREGGGEVGEL